MIPDTDISKLTQAAIQVIQEPGRATVITSDNPLPELARTPTADAPAFELFHFGFSICSHKVRAVLSELGLGFGSNQFAGPTKYENYTPEYVRLRLQSDVAKNAKFVSGFSGASSVEDDGFDPLVVPTLVDNKAGKVLADSKLICLYLVENHASASNLLPNDLKDAILKEMDVIDQTPHVALLYGADPSGDTRPADIQSRMPGIHQIKFDTINAHLVTVAGDPQLTAAYEAKLEKEKAAEGFVVSNTAMQDAVVLAEKLIIDLDEKLKTSKGDWLFDDRFTLADLVWGVSLLRLDYLGKSGFWDGETQRPRVKSYYEKLATRPCLINAVLDWPGSRKRFQTT